MLARIRNATQSRHPKVEMPLSRLKVEIAKILESEGYIQGFKVNEPKDVVTSAYQPCGRSFSWAAALKATATTRRARSARRVEIIRWLLS